MSISWFLTPFDKVAADVHASRSGQPTPYPGALGRGPTPAELRAVLSKLRGFQSELDLVTRLAPVSRRDGSGRPGLIYLHDFQGEDRPCWLTFDVEDELMVKVAVGVAKRCGPQRLWDDTAGVELLVGPDATAREVQRELYRLLEQSWEQMEE
jgi:hypothetical protein